MRDAFIKAATDAPDLLKTTQAQDAKDRVAFDLGLGDGEDLASAGLMAKSNLAIEKLNDLLNRKDKQKSFAELIHLHMLEAFGAINAEMDWLDEQIEIEQTAIAANTAEIDFIRTLDEENIVGPDGELRDDVQALLAKHGYDDVENLELTEIMLILQTVETDLHNDNIERQTRITDYEDRHGELREHAREIERQAGADMTPETRRAFEVTIEREPREVSFEVMKSVVSDEVADLAAKSEATKNFDVESAGFSFGSPS